MLDWSKSVLSEKMQNDNESSRCACIDPIGKKTLIDASKYVVLDVETNGLSAKSHDLLSLAIYKPDTGALFHRYFPLELNDIVLTTWVNGITEELLVGTEALTQEEVDKIIEDFDLYSRTILTYGGIDERFLRHYFERHHLRGFEQLRFYNFKRDIISSRFAEGNITKDNLCKLFGIENITEVHSANNDCVLEWNLFEKLNGQQLLVTNNKVFLFDSDDYYIPASYISTYNNFKYHLKSLPRIAAGCRLEEVFVVKGGYLKKFQTNINGVVIENLINTMIGAMKVDSREFLANNKGKLAYVGTLESKRDVIPVSFSNDGLVITHRPQDKTIEKEVNLFIEALRKDLMPMIEYIKAEVFKGEAILSQELVVHEDKKILALCDLSSASSVLEIKMSNFCEPTVYKEQIFYEAKGRKAYLLQVNWDMLPDELPFYITSLDLEECEPFEDAEQHRQRTAKEKIETDEIELVHYFNTSSSVTLRCKKCGNEWRSTYYSAVNHRPCPECKKIEPKKRKGPEPLSEEEKLQKRAEKFCEKVYLASGKTILASGYTGAKEKVHLKCRQCGKEWDARADHVMSRCFCPRCR